MNNEKSDIPTTGSNISANPSEKPENDTPKLVKKIGSTTYEVSMFFSKTSKETIDDKIMRLIKNDTNLQ